jgi:hypothetical protein
MIPGGTAALEPSGGFCADYAGRIFYFQKVVVNRLAILWFFKGLKNLAIGAFIFPPPLGEG